MKKFLNWIKSPSSDFILFILLLVLINIAGYNSFARIDLTKTKSYSLSKGSKVLVKNLESPLSVRVFFDENLPSPYSSTALYVKDLLSEYKGAANKNFSLINVDLSKKDNVQLAMDYGLNKIQIQEIKNNEVGFKQVYMGLVLTYGDSVEVIDGITNSDGFEYKFTSTITKMIGTLDALSSLKAEEKIDVTLYVSESLKLFGIQGTDDLESIVEKSIEDANKMNMNCLNYKVVHPLSDEVPALIEKYGIQGIQFKDSNGTIQNAALGLIIEQNDKFRILPVNVQKSIFNYEISGLDYLSESITQNLQSLVSKVTNIGYVTG
ncbi:MAG: ABC transporter, partial [Treponema sp.]|nr:ABC transporter [Treponema sp.]